ncbi:Cyclomaltodextrinase [Symbiodinium microadriaticum]|uniref:Cyclomaltodextrinase n=1 Tax=Symbiodinium microadriaticum TaxID=2951 RepID=A0A1Q9DEM9_SYMMI|nr:Cyclomaltodextrinase [Symbiodinium microadriaticum]
MKLFRGPRGRVAAAPLCDWSESLRLLPLLLLPALHNDTHYYNYKKITFLSKFREPLPQVILRFEENTRRYLVGLPAKVQKAAVLAAMLVQEDLDMDQFVARWPQKAMEDAKRPVFGAEAERIGTRLDEATDEFLKETKSCRALQIPPGQDQLTAMEYVAYLGINLQLEPELSWVAREMLAAPMPPQAEMKVSKAGVCYFHDLLNDYYTIEHPLTQRYLKVLERQRLDLLCLRTKPSVNGLLFSQPDMLFNKQFRNLQIPCQSCGVMQSTLKCNQCLMSFCQSCADALHKNALGPRFEEVFAHYKAEGYTKKEVQSYWDQAKAEKPAKAKAARFYRDSKVQPEPKPKAKVGPMKTRRRRDKDWRIGAIVYQLFVDRFAPPDDFEAKKKLYPDVAEATFHGWKELPKGGQLVESAGYYSNELAFWGGDLPSLTSKLDYIDGLGIDVLYLQPITKSYSNHKYDTIDYKQLDSQYGTDADFKSLSDKVHDKGMKLVLDFVFNHCGKRCQLVKDALADASSPKRKYFFMGDEYKPHGYKVWGCAPALVEFALENKELQKHLWDAPDSALATWLSKGADGARLDVASEIGLELLASITRAAHKYKKVMSLHMGVLVYGLAEGVLPGPSAAQSLSRMIADSSMDEANVLVTPTMESTHRRTDGQVTVQARKFAQCLQFTWPGCPLIYYGDELGLEGGEDPHNRAPMPWERNNDQNEMLKHTKMLMLALPYFKSYVDASELRITGDYRDLPTTKLMAFIRTTDRVSDVMIVLANPTSEVVKEMVVVPVPAILGHTLFKDDLPASIDQLSGEEMRLLGSTLTVDVAPKTVRVYAMVNEVGNPKNHTFLTTACGSLCSTCAVKKPQVFCANCEDYFCFKCFEDMHRRGNRLQHKSMLVSVSDGDVIEPQKRCEECEDRPAAFACDYCLDNYCVQCFWKCHFNGHRRQHTASKVAVVPMCNQCQNVRATIFSEQTQELMCTECFTMLHAKGNRMLHLFMDSMDLLVLLERLDPAFQEHMRRARPRVLWALSQLQGWVKGIEARRNFKKRKDVVLMIQRRWRGVLTRRRLLGMLHMHKWRRRQVNNYFLPKTAAERRAVKQKTTAMLSAKDVTTRAANQSLRELRQTILSTANADPLEDAQLTRDQMEALPGAVDNMAATVSGFGGFGGGAPSGAQTAPPGGISPYTSYEQSSRFNGAITGPAGAATTQDLSKKDIRNTRDSTLRQITRLD